MGMIQSAIQRILGNELSTADILILSILNTG